MRINTNVAAINANKNLQGTNASISKSMEKLSSGFRINRAADDAAGLGIANKLRGDIRSMTQASRNADQATGFLQIAEGGVGSIQQMLERMKELATQAGSDTVDAGGRTRIQEEFAALQSEITRTIETTKFQGTQLLKGATTPAANAVTANAAAFSASAGFDSVDITGMKGTGTFTIQDDGAGNLTVTNGTLTDTFTAAAAKAGVVTGANTGISFQLDAAYANGDFQTAVTAADAVIGVEGVSATANFDSIDLTDMKGTGAFTIVEDGSGNITVTNGTLTDTFTTVNAKAGVVTGANTGISFQLDAAYSDGDLNAVAGASQTINVTTAAVAGVALGADQSFDVTTAATEIETTGSFSFLVSSSAQYATNDVVSVSAFNLELTTLGIDGDSLSTLSGAQTALTNLDTAMERVSSLVGEIGAYQNRIDYAQQNIKTTIQNFSAAESVIRDLDMAEEMSKFSKNQILSQAGTAMLAQANQSAQGVLQLLRG
jgi:flagellin